MYFLWRWMVLIFQSALLDLVFPTLALYPQSYDVRTVRHWSLYLQTLEDSTKTREKTKRTGNLLNLFTCLL
ncbi:uncharacterized protein B0J16DRAFT_60349 [Fusarium flagelliforme]|jgi:hypothetical protein|uniref:uncharacterized protein n=1 Tax=Fusarium flagelliforme TaxID=2675880 RepID=UPI001E8D4CAA|nr:uncharacterized protein B0J16DRAFT_60349 [Fusarium flagelliforme]KAH7192452.1 hypothetical protein B0J16DRAFT_60349 [Fusarium flagelliforme]